MSKINKDDILKLIPWFCGVLIAVIIGHAISHLTIAKYEMEIEYATKAAEFHFKGKNVLGKTLANINNQINNKELNLELNEILKVTGYPQLVRVFKTPKPVVPDTTKKE